MHDRDFEDTSRLKSCFFMKKYFFATKLLNCMKHEAKIDSSKSDFYYLKIWNFRVSIIVSNYVKSVQAGIQTSKNSNDWWI